ncbi:unnamed protein product [Protopolystoma xenopodis]|uniref:Uncharacterized protein n=1 Tax=Protopolystoma xenopodis TaxID=117903 RepID=A0A3S5BFP5_9PLAT|nr:unnamed protein product [Protopolystoma xenopodis]
MDDADHDAVETSVNVMRQRSDAGTRQDAKVAKIRSNPRNTGKGVCV